MPRAWVETDLDDLLAADAPRRAMHRAAALLEASTAYTLPLPITPDPNPTPLTLSLTLPLTLPPDPTPTP